MGVAGTNTYPRCSHCGQHRTTPGDVLRCPHCGRAGRRLLNGYCDECVEKRASSGVHLTGARRCLVRDCSNYTDEGRFIGDVCSPCWSFMITGRANSSQACRNVLREVSRLLGEKAMESVGKFVADAIYVAASAAEPGRDDRPGSMPDGEELLVSSLGKVEKVLSTKVDDLMELSVRATNCLERILPTGTVGELVQFTEWQLLKIPHMGKKTVREVVEVLARMGLSLKKEP